MYSIRFEVNGETQKSITFFERVHHIDETVDQFEGDAVRIELPENHMCMVYGLHVEAESPVSLEWNGGKEQEGVYFSSVKTPVLTVKTEAPVSSVRVIFDLRTFDTGDETQMTALAYEMMDRENELSSALDEVRSEKAVLKKDNERLVEELEEEKNRGLFSSPKKKKKEEEEKVSASPENTMEISNLQKVEENTWMFERPCLVSLICPVKNVSEEKMKAMLSSVIAQTYVHWELCIADESDDDFDREALVESYGDSRIVYETSAPEKSFASALTLATGEIYGFLGQADRLHPSALYDVMRKMEETGCDFVYTDEDGIRKPDFGMDDFYAGNFIGHGAYFRKEFYEESSGMYDLYLKIYEKTQKFEHVPRVRYYAEEKAEAGDMKVLKQHFRRTGIDAKAVQGGDYIHVTWPLKEMPLVSIAVDAHGDAHRLERCINAILARTVYEKYEILILKDGSEDLLFNTVAESYEKTGKIRSVGNISDAGGDLIVLVQDWIRIVTPDWLERMAALALRENTSMVVLDDTLPYVHDVHGENYDVVMRCKEEKKEEEKRQYCAGEPTVRFVNERQG